MPRFLRLLLVAGLAISSAHGASSPHSGWTLVPGAEDLIAAGAWSCVSQVSAGANALTISAGSSYVTPVNTSGPRLAVQGDFSVLATISAATDAGAFLTLEGALSTGPNFWNGLKRLDLGIGGGGIQVNWWTGDSATPGAQSFPLPSGTSGPIPLEAARIGTQLVFFAGGTELGRIDDPGIFASGRVYLGFNVAPQNTLTVSALAAAMPSDGSSTVTLSSASLQTIPRTGTALRDLAGASGFLVGAAVNPSLLSNSAYAQTLGREFNLIVPENVLKFDATEPAPFQYSFCAADQLVAFAQANGMKMRGHNLVWHQQIPSWVTNGNYTPDQAANILHDHIVTVAGRYQGKLIDWDVVNEGIANSPPYGLQPSYWLTQLGSGYIDQAFLWAHDADPTAKLFYNDYGGEGLGAKSDAIYNMVKGMLGRGVPIDGVGLEMHLTLNGAPSFDSLSANIQRLGALGLQVHITELDVRLPVPASDANLAAQAQIYQNVAAACLANANCTAMLTWGISDAYSWIPGSFPGFGAALMFDQLFLPKPNYSAVWGLLAPLSSSVQIATDGTGVLIHGGTSTNLSPGSLVDISGANLATITASAPAGAAALPLTLAGTQVSINGAAAPLLYVSPSLIVAQVPYEIAPGAATAVVTNNGTVGNPASTAVQVAAPSIFTDASGHALATNCTAPGNFATVYLTGSGPLDNPIPTGTVAPLSPPSSETLTTAVTLGGQPAMLMSALMTPGMVGVLQVTFAIPPLPAGDAQVMVSIGDAQSNQALFCVSQQ